MFLYLFFLTLAVLVCVGGVLGQKPVSFRGPWPGKVWVPPGPRGHNHPWLDSRSASCRLWPLRGAAPRIWGTATVSVASWSKEQTKECKSSQMATSDLISGREICRQTLEAAGCGDTAGYWVRPPTPPPTPPPPSEVFRVRVVSVSLFRSTGGSRNYKSPPSDARSGVLVTRCLYPEEIALPSVGRGGRKKKKAFFFPKSVIQWN